MQITVKGARRVLGLSQAEVAESLGVSIPTYRRMENDPGCMSLDAAKKLVEILGVVPDDLVLEVAK